MPTQTFTGDVSQLLKELQRLEAQNKKLHETQAHGAKEAKRHHSEAEHHVTEQISSLKHMAIEYLTVEKGIEAVTEAFSAMQEKMKEVAERNKEINQELLRNIALSGQSAHSGEIIAGLKSSGISLESAEKLFGAIHEGMPGQTNHKTLLAMTRAAAKIPAAVRSGNEGELGEFIGQMATMFPDKSPEEIRDIALVTRQGLGKYAKGFESRRQFPAARQLVQSGFFASPEEGLGTLTAAAETNPRLAQELLNIIQTQHEKPHGQALRSAKGKAEAALSGKTDAEKAAILRQHPEFVTALGAKGYEGIAGSTRATDATGRVVGASGEADRMAAALGQTPEGAEVAAGSRVAATKAAKEREAYAATGERSSRASEFIAGIEAQSDAEAGTDPRSFGAAGNYVARGLNKFMARVFAKTANAFGADVDPDMMAAAVSAGLEGKIGEFQEFMGPEGAMMMVEKLERIAEETKRAREEAERRHQENHNSRQGAAAVTNINEP